MSQLNNEENNFKFNNPQTNYTKPKMKTITKTIIFLFIFTFIAACATTGAIIYTNKNSSENNLNNLTPNTENEFSKPIEVPSDELGITSLTEQYNENDLKISTLTDTKGTRVPTSEWDTNTNKLTINYIQIDGLKDSKIEDQINNEVKNLVYSLYSADEIDSLEIDSIHIYTYCNANFGNALSLTVSKSISYIDKDIANVYSSYNLNYNLVTGKKLKFTDLFTNASIRNALAESVYDNVLSNYYDEVIDEDNPFLIDMSKADLSTVEDETYILVNKIMNNLDNIDFSFTTSYISYSIGETSLSIDMADIHNNIAIYNKFKTDASIFDGTYSGQKNIFVFTTRYVDVETPYTYYEDVYDNLRIEAVVYYSPNSEASEVLSEADIKPLIDSCIIQIENKISDVKNIAKNNPNNAYIYTAYYAIYAHSDYYLNNFNIKNLMISCNGTDSIYTMNKQYYTNTYYPSIAEFYRADVPYVRFVFEDYVDENDNVAKDEYTNNIEDFDFYTKKSKDELLQEYYDNLEQQFNNNITLEIVTP